MNESMICYWNALHYADISRIFREIAVFCKKQLRTNYKPETDIELDWQFSVNSLNDASHYCASCGIGEQATKPQYFRFRWQLKNQNRILS